MRLRLIIMLSLLGLCFGLCLGCHTSKEPRLFAEDHLKQLEHMVPDTLGGEVPDAFRHAPKLPSARARRFTLTPVKTINIRDFFGISDCPLTQLIGYRNSPLGRVMLPSQELAYQHQFLSAAARCQVTGKLKETLDRAVAHKRSQWPQRHWNAVWGGKTIARLFSLSGDQDAQLSSGHIERLKWLAALSPETEGELSSRLEETLSAIPSYTAGATIARAREGGLVAQRQQRALKRALGAIKTKRAGGANNDICRGVKEAQQGFTEARTERIKRAKAMRDLQEVLRPLSQITSEAPSPEMQIFLIRWLSSERGSALETMNTLSAEIDATWSALTKECEGS